MAEPRHDSHEPADPEALQAGLVRGFARALGVPPDAALAEYVRTGAGALPGGARLLAWDANSVHAFVFDSTNATGIRGASGVLRELDDTLRAGEDLGLEPGQVLYAGGGAGAAVVSEIQVERAVECLHELFARRTLVATCSVADVALSGDRGFGEQVAKAGLELARDRFLAGADTEPDVPFFVERCAVCGRRAATGETPRGTDHRLRLECAPCDLRIEAGKRLAYRDDERSDFDDIAGGGAGRQGDLAVVYLDGNGVGRTLRKLASPLAYARFSRAMAAVLRASFDEVAERYGIKRPEGSAEPGEERYQLPICGGDDLVAILPGQVALPLVRDLIEGFVHRAGSDSALAGARLGAAAGIALGRGGFPIRNLIEEAEELLKVAKRRVYDPCDGSAEASAQSVAAGSREAPAPRSALAFAVVRDGTPRAGSVEPERWAKTDGDLHASGVPYTLEEFRRLSDRRRTFRRARIGPTQLFALRRAAEGGEAVLRSHVLYQVGRSGDWQSLVRDLAEQEGGEADPLTQADVCYRAVVPEYGGRRTFDVADLIPVMNRWRELDEGEEELGGETDGEEVER